VHVGIDESGKNRGITEIMDLCLGRDLLGSDNVEDAVSFNKQGGWTHGAGSHNAAGEEGAQVHSEKRTRRKSRENETKA